MDHHSFRLVRVGYVDEYELVHELQITEDGIPAAKERGWMVLDEAVLGIAAFNPPKLVTDGDDDGA